MALTVATAREACQDNPGHAAGSPLAHHGGERASERARRVEMKKYVAAWLLGVPVSVLAVIYLLSHGACG